MHDYCYKLLKCRLLICQDIPLHFTFVRQKLLVTRVQIVDASTLQDVDDVRKCKSCIAVAAIYGSVRLIDNISLEQNPDASLKEAQHDLDLLNS